MGICPLTTKSKASANMKITPLKLKQAANRDIKRKYNLRYDQVLGMGQFGKVIMATNAFDPRQKVAVKALSKDKLGDKIVKLKKEVVFLRKLDSPYVVKYHEFFEDDKYFYLVMEYCPGGELFREIAMKLEQHQRYKERDAAVIMQKLFKAVSHIHSKGIAHRDIKPENIIWHREKDDTHFKLIDFGLAHKFVKKSQISTGMIVGTPLYLAPEAFDGISTIEADLWGCGVLLCVMLSGSYPYVGNNISELRCNIQEAQEVNLSQHLWQHVSEEGKDIVKKLMNLDPKLRISAQDALDHPWFDKYCPAITLKHNVHTTDNLHASILRHKHTPVEGNNLLSRSHTLQMSDEVGQVLIFHPFGTFPKDQIASELIERMWAYSQPSFNPRFRRIALNALVRLLPDSDINNLTKQFEILDTNHTCQLEFEEILEGVQSAGITHYSHENILKMVEQIDMTGSKTIFYTEFLAATIDLQKLLAQYEDDSLLHALYKDFDHQAIDMLTVQNLTASLTRMGKEITIQQVETIIRELQLPHQELSIDFSSFKRIIMQDPLTLMQEKEDKHPLFIREDDA